MTSKVPLVLLLLVVVSSWAPVANAGELARRAPPTLAWHSLDGYHHALARELAVA
jgi:hypothetical protein